VGNRALIVLTFDDANGGSSRIDYTVLAGLFPRSETNVTGTFTIE